MREVPITVEDFEPPLTEADLAKIEAIDAFLRKHRWLRFARGERRRRLLAELLAIVEAPF